MLEGVLGVREERHLVHELRGRELLQRRRELRRGQLDHACQDGLRELPADHRGRLQHLLAALPQPVDPRRQHGLHGRRDAHLLHGSKQTIRALAAHEDPRLDQPTYCLLDEERISARALVKARRETCERRATAEKVGHQGSARLGPERYQGALLVVGRSHPARAELGAEVEQQEPARPGLGCDERLEERVAAPVEPV